MVVSTLITTLVDELDHPANSHRGRIHTKTWILDSTSGFIRSRCNLPSVCMWGVLNSEVCLGEHLQWSSVCVNLSTSAPGHC